MLRANNLSGFGTGTTIPPFFLAYVGYVTDSTNISASGSKTWSSTTIGTQSGEATRKLIVGVQIDFDNSLGNTFAAADVSLDIGGVTFGSGGEIEQRNISTNEVGDRSAIGLFEIDATTLSNTENITITAGTQALYNVTVTIWEMVAGTVTDTERMSDASNSSAVVGVSVTMVNDASESLVVLGMYYNRDTTLSYSGYTEGHNLYVETGGPNDSYSHCGTNAAPSVNQVVSITPRTDSRSMIIVGVVTPL